MAPLIPHWLFLTSAIAGPILGVIFCTAQLPELLKAYRGGSTGPLTAVPTALKFANGFLWFCYGILLNDPSILLPNCYAITICIFEVLVFGSSCKNKKMVFLMIGIIFASIAAFVVDWLVHYFLGNSPTISLGFLGTAVGLGLYAAPLTDLPRIIRQKSCASISLPASVASFVMCISWVLFSLGKDKVDYSILIGNVVGIVFNAFIILLFAIFWKNTKIEKANTIGRKQEQEEGPASADPLKEQVSELTITPPPQENDNAENSV